MDITPFSEREWIMAGALAVTLALGLASFFARYRAGLRFHIALSTLSVLVSGFVLILALTSALPTHALSGVAVFVFLALLFKIMNQFEINK